MQSDLQQGQGLGDQYSCVGFPGRVDRNIKMETKFGGPLVCMNDDGAFELQGIASSDSKDINKGHAGLFTNIYNNLGWLEDEMSGWTDWTKCSTECKRQRTRVCTQAGFPIDDSTSIRKFDSRLRLGASLGKPTKGTSQ